MKTKLYYNTVTDQLLAALKTLMAAAEFEQFRLVGGTSLSLQLGHRISVDIDLFTDAQYKSVDFDAIDTFLRSNFPYVYTPSFGDVAMGKSYYVGDNEDSSVKLDLYYTDSFIRPIRDIDNIRLADIEDIAAMKLEVAGNGGRKKDFWDIDELCNTYSVEQMLAFYAERYPYSHERADLIKSLTSFTKADEEPDPVSLRDKPWQIIKLDIESRIKPLLEIPKQPAKRSKGIKM